MSKTDKTAPYFRAVVPRGECPRTCGGGYPCKHFSSSKSLDKSEMAEIAVRAARPVIEHEKAGYIAMLEDAVVAAAVVIFGGGNTPQTNDYLMEGLYEQAKEIVEKVERLKGSWTP